VPTLALTLTLTRTLTLARALALALTRHARWAPGQGALSGSPRATPWRSTPVPSALSWPAATPSALPAAAVASPASCGHAREDAPIELSVGPLTVTLTLTRTRTRTRTPSWRARVLTLALTLTLTRTLTRARTLALALTRHARWAAALLHRQGRTARPPALDVWAHVVLGQQQSRRHERLRLVAQPKLTQTPHMRSGVGQQ